jgi:two-component system chemotaxis sensor kinase CheA
MINELQQEFIEEARQILKNLEQSLLELENNKLPEQINNVYRYMHTLKGSAGMFGFTNIEKLSHELENVYSDVRDGIRPLDEFIIDLTLHAVDVFKDMIDGKESAKESAAIIQTLKSVTDTSSIDHEAPVEISNGERVEGVCYFSETRSGNICERHKCRRPA